MTGRALADCVGVLALPRATNKKAGHRLRLSRESLPATRPTYGLLVICPARTRETALSGLPRPTPQADKFRRLSVPWSPRVWPVRLPPPFPCLTAYNTSLIRKQKKNVCPGKALFPAGNRSALSC